MTWHALFPPMLQPGYFPGRNLVQLLGERLRVDLVGLDMHLVRTSGDAREPSLLMCMTKASIQAAQSTTERMHLGAQA
jgi:hypothetical protein